MGVKFNDFAYTTLDGGISAGATSFVVASAASLPTLGVDDYTFLYIEEDVVKVTDITGTTCTCVGSTVNVDHLSGVAVELRMGADLLEEFATDEDVVGFSNQNILINSKLEVNRLDFDGNWGALSDGEFGWERWRKSSANMIQPIKEGNYIPSTEYYLFGDGVTNTTIISPASDTWEISVPQAAISAFLVVGDSELNVGTTSYDDELKRCQPYLFVFERTGAFYDALGFGYARTSTTVHCLIPCPCRMIDIPEYIGDLIINARIITNGQSITPGVSGPTVDGISDSGLLISLDCSGATANHPVTLIAETMLNFNFRAEL